MVVHQAVRSLVGLAAAAGFLAGAGSPALGLPYVSVLNRLDTGWNRALNRISVEDRLDARAGDRRWRAHIRLRVNQTGGTGAAAGSDSVGVEQRSLTIQTPSLSVTAGTYHETFGRALVLRLHENRAVTLARAERAFSLDRDADGVLLSGSLGSAEITVLSGRPRLTPASGSTVPIGAGERPDLLQAASGSLRLLDGAVTAGGAVVAAHRNGIAGGDHARPRQTLRSLRGEVGLGASGAYLEWADIRWHGARPTLSGGRGLYGAVHGGVGRVSAVLEYKNYDRLVFPYAEPPTLIRTHDTVLLNQATHVQRPSEEGFQFEGILAGGGGATALNLTGAWSGFRGRKEHFRELFVEHRREGSRTPWTVFADWSEEVKVSGAEDRWTGGGSLEPLLDPSHSLFLDVEAQRAVPERQDPFWNGFVQAGFSRAGRFTAAVRYQWTSREPAFEGDRMGWPAATLNVELGAGHDLYLFGGARPAGLVCSGGFCFFAPEFEGIEARLLSSF